MIHVKIDGHCLTATTDDKLVAKCVNTVYFEANFDDSWDGCEKRLVFSANRNPGVPVTYTGGAMLVPWNALDASGWLYISAVGLAEGKRDVTAMMHTPLFVYANGDLGDDSTAPDYDPSPLESAVLACAKSAKEAEDAARRAEEAARRAEDAIPTEPGGSGRDGGHYTPKVTQPDSGRMRMSFTPSREDMPSVPDADVELPPGPRGAPGLDGKDGAPGEPGTDGQDGVTPHIGENGNWFVGDTDTGVKAEGVPGKDGIDGKDGDTGPEGPAGYTPVKGEDYFTEQDKQEIVHDVLDEIPEGGGIDISGASVGQTIKIAAVDDKGVPTAWEPVEFPSGGGAGEKEWKVLRNITVPDDPELDNSGITWTVNNDGNVVQLFSDTDDNGESFSVSEMILYSNVGSYDGLTTGKMKFSTAAAAWNIDDTVTLDIGKTISEAIGRIYINKLPGLMGEASTALIKSIYGGVAQSYALAPQIYRDDFKMRNCAQEGDKLTFVRLIFTVPIACGSRIKIVGR